MSVFFLWRLCVHVVRVVSFWFVLGVSFCLFAVLFGLVWLVLFVCVALLCVRCFVCFVSSCSNILYVSFMCSVRVDHMPLLLCMYS